MATTVRTLAWILKEREDCTEAEPDAGHDIQAAECRAKREAWQVATEPAQP